MKGLSPGQAKTTTLAAEMLAKMVFAHSPAGYDIFIQDKWMHCRLMANKVFDEKRCYAVSRAGNPSCMICSHCPPLRTINEFKEGTMSTERGICAKCGEERALQAKKMCFKCNYGEYKDLTKEDIQKMKDEGTWTARPYKSRKTSKKADSPAQEPLQYTPPLSQAKGVIQINIRSREDNELYDRILELSRKNRRGPGEEMLALAERALNNGASEGKVEIGKIKKIVERMQLYPIPEGSPKEVFRKAFDMMLIRLDEMSE